MMEILVLDNLAEDKIRDQQRPKSTFVPFRNMVPQRPQILPALKTTPIKHLSEAKMQARREKELCYNCDENSAGCINVLGKISISWMWLLHLRLKIVKMLRI